MRDARQRGDASLRLRGARRASIGRRGAPRHAPHHKPWPFPATHSADAMVRMLEVPFTTDPSHATMSPVCGPGMARRHQCALQLRLLPGKMCIGGAAPHLPMSNAPPPASGGPMYRQALLAAALFTGAAEPPPSTGRIEGTVRDSAGVPVANAQVIVVSRPWTAMSDSLGRFRLADIPAGRYTIQVSAIGYGRREVTGVSVTAGATTRLDLTLKPSTVDEVVAQTGVAKRAEADGREMSRMVPTQGAAANGLPYPAAEPVNTEEYDRIREGPSSPPRPIRSPPSPSTSTPRRYSNMRRFLTRRAAAAGGRRAHRGDGQLLRLRLPEPRRASTRSRSPPRSRPRRGHPEHQLVRIGLQGRRSTHASVPPSNLVFLIDVSAPCRRPTSCRCSSGIRAARGGAAPPGSRRHRRVRRRRRAGAAVHPRQRQGEDPRGASTGSRPAARPPAARGSGSPTRWPAQTSSRAATTA